MIRKIPPPCMMTQGMISGMPGDTPEIPDNGEKVIYTTVMTRRVVVCVCDPWSWRSTEVETSEEDDIGTRGYYSEV